MKKIWIFTVVKNEEDIIECFVRYHLNIVDGIVICDNCSSDNTLSILKSLKSENLNIDILVDKDEYFDQTKKRNELLQYVIEKYSPDYVFPVDADEFICSFENNNPRKEILKLDANVAYKYRMINYAITNEDIKTNFIPQQRIYKVINNEDECCYYKIIIPKEVYLKGINLFTGSHDIVFKNGEVSNAIISEKLFLAHYPVRSKEQIMNKVITGRLNNSSLHSREEGLGFHQYEILDTIIKSGTISTKKLREISKYYGVKNKSFVVGIEKSPINLSFCKNLNILYAPKFNKKEVLINTIKNAETIINHMRERNKENSIAFEKAILDKNNEIENLNTNIIEKDTIIAELNTNIIEKNSIINKLNNEKEEMCFYNQTLNETINNILKSKSWKVTKIFRDISNIIINRRNEDEK